MHGMIRIIALGCALWLMGCFGSEASAGEVSPAVTSYTREERQLLDAYESGFLIRLHVLAEDNTPEAQRVKLAVRDAILRAFSSEWPDMDADALYQQLQANVGAMKAVAEATARDSGFDGPVSAEVGMLTLPEKRYGQVTLPSGPYRGLRIILGKGEGQNWWCVLYPSLCLAVADDDPWRADPLGKGGPEAPEGLAEVGASPEIVWDTERIVSQWLLWPEG